MNKDAVEYIAAFVCVFCVFDFGVQLVTYGEVRVIRMVVGYLFGV